ncbi:MAG TPA: RNA methyltransferase [Acidobacteriota bacterium]|nr:RNA methyltransferase [Acidobacteriota bacterium]
MTSAIESRHNPRFKQWKRYLQHPQQADCPWVPVEGYRHVAEAAASVTLELLLYCDPDDSRLPSLRDKAVDSVHLTPSLFNRLSGVKTPQGVMAFVKKPHWSADDLTDCVLVADGLQDPGNLGTLMRSAAAVGASMASTAGSVSRFNLKAVRASASLLFRVPFLEDVSFEALGQRGYVLWTASAQGRRTLFQTRIPSRLAVILGSEGRGPSAAALHHSQGRVRIPMRPEAESLNASVAGSLILYEWFRRGGQEGWENASLRR